MPLTIPTKRELREFVRDQILARVPEAGALLPFSTERGLADAAAGLSHLEHAHLQWISRQMLPDTAETEWLDRHADIWLEQPRKLPTLAAGSVTVMGDPGGVVPVGAILTTSTLDFEVLEELTLVGTTGTVSVRAVDPGAAGNLPTGTVLSFLVAHSGIEAQATVATAFTGGTDEESDDSLRDRLLQHIQDPPQGSARSDYYEWARSVPGITRAWISPLEQGLGTVVVRVMADDLRADNGGLPTEDDLAAVRAAIEARRPVTAHDFWVVAPIPEPVDLTISGLSKRDSVTKGNIEAALRRAILRRARPGQTFYRSWLAEAISSAAGEVYHDLEATNVLMPSPGHMATLGSITYA